MDKLTVRDADVAGQRVFVRVDFNVPLADGKVTDDSRIRAAIPTIALLLNAGARVVLASHLGRPDGKVQDGLRLRPVGLRLTELIRRNVPVTGDALGVGTVDAVNRLRPGELLLLENLRFHAEEEANDPAFAAALAAYADIYVNDAFGTAHRAHASTVGIAKLLPAYAGLLMEREIEALSNLLEAPKRPFAAILGGAKVSDKIKVIDHLLTKVDMLVLGGGMANTFLLAQGKAVGKSLAEPDRADDARRILETAEKNGVRVVLPIDVIVAKEVTRGTEYKTLPAEKIPASWHIVDLGKASQDLIMSELADVQTVFWNGPLGVFEIPSFAHGTNAIARMLAERAEAGATVVVGGGDSVAAVTQQGLADKMTHISTGGGASLEFLEGRDLPGVDRPARPPGRPNDLIGAFTSVDTVIDVIDAREILDSRGNPTVEVDVVLADGSVGRAAVPSGASTGAHEAVELRDGDKSRFGGKGVLKAVANVTETIAPALLRARRLRPGRHRRRADRARRDAQQGRARRERDPRRLARVRARLGVLVRPAAVPLPRRRRRADAAGPDVQHPQRRQARPGLDRLPGVHGHAGRRGDVQRRAPRRAPRSSRRCAASSTTRGTRRVKGDEGGFAPSLASNEAAVEVILRAIERAGYRPGEDVAIALDPATTELVEPGSGEDGKPTRYVLAKEGRTLDSGELIDLWADWVARLPDRVARGRPGRGRLGRLAGADRLGSAARSSSSATTCSSPTPSASRAASSSRRPTPC